MEDEKFRWMTEEDLGEEEREDEAELSPESELLLNELHSHFC